MTEEQELCSYCMGYLPREKSANRFIFIVINHGQHLERQFEIDCPWVVDQQDEVILRPTGLGTSFLKDYTV